MKLSEAIRKGCKKTKKTTGIYYTHNRESACALGAAAIAIGQQGNFLESVWKFLTYNSIDCPVANCKSNGTVFDIVTHLNDEEEIEREQIAYWLGMVGV